MRDGKPALRKLLRPAPYIALRVPRVQERGLGFLHVNTINREL
jgi:hypothetical protein